MSQDLLDQVNRSFRAKLRRADGQHSVQEGVLRRGSLEAGRGAEVRTTGSSVVADTLEGHVDERGVVGLKRDSQIDLDDAVRSLDGPVVPARKNLAAQPVSLEHASGDRKGHARPVRSRSDVLRGCSVEMKRHEWTGLH